MLPRQAAADLLVMRTRKLSSVLFFLIMLPMFAAADYDCIDSRPSGNKIKLDKYLPKEWLIFGDRVLNDSKFHSELRARYKDHYVVNENGSGYVCLYSEGVYVTVSNSDFGPWVEFSSIAPKCLKCSLVKGDTKNLVSKSGLRLGQSKAEVSTLLYVSLESDIVEISFEELEKGVKFDTRHVQSLTIEFQSDKLIRFTVYDYREGA